MKENTRFTSKFLFYTIFPFVILFTIMLMIPSMEDFTLRACTVLICDALSPIVLAILKLDEIIK